MNLKVNRGYKYSVHFSDQDETKKNASKIIYD